MKHFVLGGNGFTGTHLVRALRRRGDEVVVVDIDDNGHAQAAGAVFVNADITDAAALEGVAFGPDDVVHNLAARQYHLPVPRQGQDAYFQAVNLDGTRVVLEQMLRQGCRRLVAFSTDMVYGFPEDGPIPPTHRRCPIGPYGRSKMLAENLCFAARADGIRVTVFRPRLIVGPGRLGVLVKLFKLIRAGMPVPLIGDGSNRYQMVSVFDVVDAVLAAVERGVPDGEYNLGSDAPPTVRQLLGRLIASTGSRSRLVGTPGSLVKAVLAGFERLGLPLMYREQYSIADINYLVDIGQTRRDLGWTPRHGDADMIAAAYEEFTRR
jgi:nucleoside-diphosphate-sugar epimerase